MEAHNNILDYDALDEMKYLHRCVKESLRLNPPLILIMRKVLKEFDIKGYHIPKVYTSKVWQCKSCTSTRV
jgi:sterol 14alpha-demethylase